MQAQGCDDDDLLLLDTMLPDLNELSNLSCQRDNPASCSSSCSENDFFNFGGPASRLSASDLNFDVHMLPDLREISRTSNSRTSKKSREAAPEFEENRPSALTTLDDNEATWFSALSASLQILSALRMVDHGEVRGWVG
jgi:hypothetical protein